jgi:hypothetical protein
MEKCLCFIANYSTASFVVGNSVFGLKEINKKREKKYGNNDWIKIK